MPLLDSYPRVSLSQIHVPASLRQRQAERLADGSVDTSGLEASISRQGVIMPLLVEEPDPTQGDPRFVLVAGERRLQSCKNLVASGQLRAANGQDLTTVPVRLASDLTRIEARMFELEENCKRKDLAWQDSVRALAELHALFVAQDSEWTQRETAEAASITPGWTSMFLQVAEALDDERVQQATSARQAYEILQRRAKRALGDALDELAGVPITATPAGLEGEPLDIYSIAREADVPVADLVEVETSDGTSRVIVASTSFRQPPPSESILCADFLSWAPLYEGPSFNLIHCDFPYGVNLFNGPQGQGLEHDPGYTDTLETYEALLICLCENLDRLMSLSGHLMFWYSNDLEHRQLTERLFARLAPSLAFTRFPLIWHKSDGKGIAADWRREPRHVYETCLLGSRGARQILQVLDDHYSAPVDRSLHASTKPEPMLRHFMSMLVDSQTRLLDPTCGSGSSLRAAESLGAKVLGLELDPANCEIARNALKQSRTLRQQSRAVEALG